MSNEGRSEAAPNQELVICDHAAQCESDPLGMCMCGIPHEPTSQCMEPLYCPRIRGERVLCVPEDMEVS